MRVREKYVAACMQARGGRIGVWDTPKYEVEYGYTVHEGRKLFRARKKILFFTNICFKLI
jgi:hypothetical protein